MITRKSRGLRKRDCFTGIMVETFTSLEEQEWGGGEGMKGVKMVVVVVVVVVRDKFILNMTQKIMQRESIFMNQVIDATLAGNGTRKRTIFCSGPEDKGNLWGHQMLRPPHILLCIEIPKEVVPSLPLWSVVSLIWVPGTLTVTRKGSRESMLNS